jgi:hypothetical protein
MDTPKKGALVSRSALERVLARAAELQGASGEETEPADDLTDAQIVDLGKEVGLAPEYIRQALAEERARIEPLTASGSGVAFRLFGANRVAAQRVVRGRPERVLTTLDRWMQRDELLRVVRQRSDRLVWEPSRGFMGNLRRVFGGRDYALFRANAIAATVVPLDETSTLVRLEADFSQLRNAAASQTVAGIFFGSAASAALAFLPLMLPIVIAPAVVVGGASYAASRQRQQHALRRALLTIELVLDRLERGDTEPPSLIRMIEAALPTGR